MTHYQRKKEETRQAAIKWQSRFADGRHSYYELSSTQAYFRPLARKYGLMREFKENGIL